MHENQVIQLAQSFTLYHDQHQLGIGDDAALILNGEHYLVWAIDTLVMGTHFYPDMPAHAIGWKSMAVNLSDFAAMNATPKGALLSLGVSEGISNNWIAHFFDGLHKACQQFKIDLLGGDTVKQTHGVQISITLLGHSTSPWLRKNAKAGHHLIITGPMGHAAAGLYCWQKDLPYPEFIQAQLYPNPRLDLVPTLNEYQISGAMDISDGLARSLELLCEASQTGCIIDWNKLTHHPAFQKIGQPEQINHWILNGGEEYELLLAVDQQDAKDICNKGLGIHIGYLCQDPEIWIENWPDNADHRLKLQGTDWGFQHFKA